MLLEEFISIRTAVLVLSLSLLFLSIVSPLHSCPQPAGFLFDIWHFQILDCKPSVQNMLLLEIFLYNYDTTSLRFR